jgi:polysaccharide deacetylase family protein (PEP-CTERM system associated)
MTHAFTIDVEEWFDGIPVGRDVKARMDPRLAVGMTSLLELMDARAVRGTFFLLGPVARDNASLVRRLAAGGHEIGCHGWSHDPLYTMSPERFREETVQARDVIEQITGAPVRSYRAAYWSVTDLSLWALDELAGLGFSCDSSIFPVKNWRYGIAGFSPEPRWIETKSGPIFEIPASVCRLFGRNVPVSGGAYFRIYPYALTRWNMVKAEQRGQPVIFYLHPWELDPTHPRLPFYWRARATHYFNLASTRPRLAELLSQFQFAPLGELALAKAGLAAQSGAAQSGSNAVS